MTKLNNFNPETLIPVGVYKNQTVSRDGTIITVQDWFDTAPSFALEASKKYKIQGFIRMNGEGTSTHILRVGFTASGGLTFNSTIWYTQGTKVLPQSTAAAVVMAQRTNLNFNVNATQNNATDGAFLYLEGIFDVNAGGDLTPGFNFPSAPGSATFTADTYMVVTEI
jgi:hypothetical protein